MTTPQPPRPEPSANTGYDTFLVPRSKTPAKTALYNFLLDHGFRFDAHTMLWHTPENATLQGRGALQYSTDHTWAKIQPPIPFGSDRLPPPLLELERVDFNSERLGYWISRIDGRPSHGR